VSCYIEQVGDEYFIYVNEYSYPSYTMLAEELLHPLIHEIQYKNPELFQEFLQECLKVKHGAIKVIVDNINRACDKEDISVKNNEIVTQVLAYKLKHIDQKQSSTFKQIITKIVEWLNNSGLFIGKR
jgi:predicted RNA-binding protein with RPS1 domain